VRRNYSNTSARQLLSLIFIVLLGATARWGYADALMRSEAVKASAIIQYYIDEQGVRVELEIGLPALKGFRNLLPDEINRELGFGDAPLEERDKRYAPAGTG
jgi:hypothetical protein